MEQAPVALHPVALWLTMTLGALMLGLPRRLVMLPLVMGCIFVPIEQRIVISGLDWSMLRLLILFAYIRLLVRWEFSSLRLLRLDKLVIALTLVVVVAYSIREGTQSALINRLGWGFDGMGMYFFCRMALRTPAEVRSTLKIALPCVMIVAVFMGIEWATGRNLFAVLGGVPEWTPIREDRLRAQGAFNHSIMAGLFGAAWMPLFATFWWERKHTQAVLGCVAATLVVIFSSSSTPLGGLLFGALALSLWRFRVYMRAMRWTLLVLLIIIHFAREKPVWHLLARVDLISGSTGWHRYHLIDQAVNHFREWWLIGISYTWHWGLNMSDVTNEYLWVGINGGVLATILMIAIVSVAFGAMGRAAKCQALPPEMRRFAWACGSMLAVHASSFIAVGYFGQMRSIWFLQLAIIAAVASWQRQAVRREAVARAAALPVVPAPAPAVAFAR